MNQKYYIIILFIIFLTARIPLNGIARDLPEPIFEPIPGTENELENLITIDFDNVDIRLFIKYIGEVTRKNFIIDPTVQGNVSVISPTKISVNEAYKVFESVLEVNGFTTVESGKITKIMPANKARFQNTQMYKDGISNDPLDKVVTQIIHLEYLAPEEFKKMILPMVSQSAVIVTNEQSGMLIITENLSNIQKVLKIVKVVDIPNKDEEVDVVPLENSSSTSISKILDEIFPNNNKGNGVSGGREKNNLKIVPYVRVNSLVVLSTAPEMIRIKSIIKMLDRKSEKADDNIHVYYLQNATASEMVKVLNSLPEQLKIGNSEKNEKGSSLSNEVKVMADEETNSIVVVASKEEYGVLENVIKKLDIPRRMVYLEALIMEVDAEKAFEVGAQWATAGTFSENSGEIVSGFSGSNGYDLLPGISADDPTLPSGYSLGLIKQGIRIGDLIFPNIAAILKAYKTDSEINIISTPQVLTTDNKKAEISVGENVPYITSRNTTASEQDYTNYEYKDVATKLSIVPHINQADTLRLDIETEVVRIKGNTTTDTPTTYKRTAKTTVILSDNDTVVIGGIIGKDSSEEEWKVPLLGDIPFLGWLFKTHTTTNNKTNMYIFITPRIVRNPADTVEITEQKSENVREQLSNNIDSESFSNEQKIIERLIEKGERKFIEKKYSEAKDYFKKVLEIEETNTYAMYRLGIIYENDKMYADALEIYRLILKNINGSNTISSNKDDSKELLKDTVKNRIIELQKDSSNGK